MRNIKQSYIVRYWSKNKGDSTERTLAVSEIQAVNNIRYRNGIANEFNVISVKLEDKHQSQLKLNV